MTDPQPIHYCSKPEFLRDASATWLPGTLVPVVGGVAVMLPNGTDYLSIQPDGSYDVRPITAFPPGTAGAYETFVVDLDLNILHLKPVPVPYAVAYRGL